MSARITVLTAAVALASSLALATRAEATIVPSSNVTATTLPTPHG